MPDLDLDEFGQMDKFPPAVPASGDVLRIFVICPNLVPRRPGKKKSFAGLGLGAVSGFFPFRPGRSAHHAATIGARPRADTATKDGAKKERHILWLLAAGAVAHDRREDPRPSADPGRGPAAPPDRLAARPRHGPAERGFSHFDHAFQEQAVRFQSAVPPARFSRPYPPFENVRLRAESRHNGFRPPFRLEVAPTPAGW